MHQSINKLVIAGGGTAGWMAAALFKKMLPQHLHIELVESEDIGIIGVGEATIPPIQTFNSVLGIDEREFLRATQATLKLAIRFENWTTPGESYFHTFGAPGTNIGFSSFHHYWLRARAQGLTTSLWDFDLNYLCCKAQVFGKIDSPDPIYQMPYAYHFDSALYGRFLRARCEQSGVKRTEGKIARVEQDADSGNVIALLLESGERIAGDFFIDCTGMRGLLIQGALNTGYEDWNHWLPCDRALAVPSERFEKTLPYTRAIAHPAGWQWRIPLQHRNGNGLVYSSSHLSDQQAADTLMANLESPALGDPKPIKFRTGRSKLQWHKNVVAVGLSSGFLEPLESTSIHLIQSALVRLLKLFPQQGISDAARDQYNREAQIEYETVRDFIILHYFLNARSDSDFWQDLQRMAIPDRLSQKLALFKTTGAIVNDPLDIFLDSSWLQVMLGQGQMPQDFHPVARQPSDAQLQEMLQRIAATKQQPVKAFPSHDQFLREYLGSIAQAHKAAGAIGA